MAAGALRRSRRDTPHGRGGSGGRRTGLRDVCHWPAEQVPLHLGLTSTGRFVFTAVAVAVTTVLAYASWRLVEHPALRQKNAAWIDGRPVNSPATP